MAPDNSRYYGKKGRKKEMSLVKGEKNNVLGMTSPSEKTNWAHVARQQAHNTTEDRGKEEFQEKKKKKKNLLRPQGR